MNILRKQHVMIPLLILLALFSYIMTKFMLHDTKVTVVESHPSYAFDISNKELLVGWAENVFIGTVMSKEKEDKDEVSPYSIYKVKVDENIKGDLKNNVKINQRVGFDNNNNQMYKMGGDEYLVDGGKYLFVTRFDESTGSYSVVPVHGDIPIKTSELEKQLKEEYKKAKDNQKDYKALLPK